MSPESFRRCPAGQNAWRLWVRDCVLSETAVMELFLFPFQWAHDELGSRLGGAVDLPYDTCHLCKRFRIDGIKVMSRGILGGKQVNLFPRVFSLSNMAAVGEKFAGKNVPVASLPARLMEGFPASKVHLSISEWKWFIKQRPVWFPLSTQHSYCLVGDKR